MSLDLFGSGPVRFVVAFVVVLALILVTAWLVRRFGANRLGGGSARGRQPRLAVIDAATVDGRRRLVLIRRDNIEHLLMIGGPTDVVIEPNIVRAAGAPAREAVRAEPQLRAPAATETPWPLQPSNEPPVVPPVAPVASPRPSRASATEEPWLPPEPGARPRPPLSGLSPDLSNRLNPPDQIAAPSRELRAEQRHEPVLPPLPNEPSSPQTDRNLAEMAQQLEAALRRAPAPEAHPPVTDALAMPPRVPAKPRAERFEPVPEIKPEPKSDYKFDSKFEPKFEPKFDVPFEPNLDVEHEPKFESKPEAKPEPRPAPAKPDSAVGATGQKSFADSLEEEMASLLGHPPGKS